MLKYFVIFGYCICKSIPKQVNLPFLFAERNKYTSQILCACFKNKQAMLKDFAAFGNCICKSIAKHVNLGLFHVPATCPSYKSLLQVLDKYPRCMSLQHVPATSPCVMSLQHVPATCPRYMSQLCDPFKVCTISDFCPLMCIGTLPWKGAALFFCLQCSFRSSVLSHLVLSPRISLLTKNIATVFLCRLEYAEILRNGKKRTVNITWHYTRNQPLSKLPCLPLQSWIIVCFFCVLEIGEVF